MYKNSYIVTWRLLAEVSEDVQPQSALRAADYMLYFLKKGFPWEDLPLTAMCRR